MMGEERLIGMKMTLRRRVIGLALASILFRKICPGFSGFWETSRRALALRAYANAAATAGRASAAGRATTARRTAAAG